MADDIRPACEHPGFYIKEELNYRAWSQADLAFVLEMSPQALNPILSGRQPITATLAVSLADAFGMPAEFFSNLQKQYDLSRAGPGDPGVRKRARWQSAYPIREMINRGWIEDTDASLMDMQMLRFFEADNLSDIPFVGEQAQAVAHAAKKTSYSAVTAEQVAWLFRVRQIARTIDVETYSKQALNDCLSNMSGLLIAPDDAPGVAKRLATCGVRFVVVESLPGAKIDGVCTWLSDNEPVIAITNRHDRLDNFWFVLRHECEHVLRGHGREIGSLRIDDDETLLGDDVQDEERVANEAASDFCVDRKQMKSFIDRKGKFASESDVLGFAKRLAIHPSIVIGQYQYATKKWSFLRKYLSSSVSGVRKFLIAEFAGSNFLDGWGSVARVDL